MEKRERDNKVLKKGDFIKKIDMWLNCTESADYKLYQLEFFEFESKSE